MPTTDRQWRNLWPVVVLAALLATVNGCGAKQAATENQAEAPAATPAAAAAETPAPEPIDPSVVERIKHEKWRGDLDGMVERRFIRALVSYNRTYYFYDGAEPRGISYEALKEFEKTLNQKLRTGNRQVSVIIIPVQRSELLQGLVDGRGDIAASNIGITPEGQALVDYSDSLRDNASDIVVTGP